MTTDKFEYNIVVADIIPPVGKVFKYYAVVSHMIVKTPRGVKKLDVSFGEVRGITKEKTKQLMESLVKDWILNQSKKWAD